MQGSSVYSQFHKVQQLRRRHAQHQQRQQLITTAQNVENTQHTTTAHIEQQTQNQQVPQAVASSSTSALSSNNADSFPWSSNLRARLATFGGENVSKRRTRLTFEQDQAEQEYDDSEKEQQEEEQRLSKRAKPIEFEELIAGLELVRAHEDAEIVSQLLTAPSILQYNGNVPTADSQSTIIGPSTYWSYVYSVVQCLSTVTCTQVLEWGVSKEWKSVKLVVLRNALPTSGVSSWATFFDSCISISTACTGTAAQFKYVVLSIALLGYLYNLNILAHGDEFLLKRAVVALLDQCMSNRFALVLTLRILKHFVFSIAFDANGQHHALRDHFFLPLVKQFNAGTMTLLIIGAENQNKLTKACPGLRITCMPHELNYDQQVGAVSIPLQATDDLFNEIKQIKTQVGLLTGINMLDMVCPMNMHHFPHLFVTPELDDSFNSQTADAKDTFYTLEEYALVVAPFKMFASWYGPAIGCGFDAVCKLNSIAFDAHAQYLSKYFEREMKFSYKKEKMYGLRINYARVFEWYSIIIDLLTGHFQALPDTNLLRALRERKRDLRIARRAK